MAGKHRLATYSIELHFGPRIPQPCKYVRPHKDLNTNLKTMLTYYDLDC